jgi:hypothetical protein
LNLRGGGDRVSYATEHDEERVPFGIQHATTMRSEDAAQHPPVLGTNVPKPSAQRAGELRRSLDVAEQERHCASR